SLQMKRSYLWGSEDGDVLTQIPSLDLEGGGDGVLRKQRDEEVDSAALETSRLKDKLKRKMSESSRGAPSESLTCAPLKPAVPRSASQRLMTAMKPVPPIQKSPTPGTPQENPPQNGDTDITSDISEISLQYVRSSAERKRKSLGGGVIPPILKSSNFPADHNDCDQLTENTPGTGSAATRRRSVLEIESHRMSDADHTDSRHITAAEDVSAPVPSKPILPTPSADSTLLPQLSRDEEGKENHTRISLSISKSAQDKMRQKQQEIENIRNQKRRSHQKLWERLQGAEAAEEPMSVTSFTLSGLNTVPITTEKRRGGANMNLNKWVSRPSLPSIPTINPEPGISDFRHSSAFSLPASFLDLSDLDSDSEGGPGSGPMSHPEQGMIEALKWLNHKDWEQKEKGLLSIRCLASWHPDILCSRIFDAFNPRMQDANKKVNQYALESAVVMIPILKDSLHHVLVPMVTVVTDTLNSKHSGIYTAAVTVMDTLIANIDKLWLLQPFASRIRFLSGRAMSDVTERLSGLVCSVYPRKPQAVERHVLPVLWFFLSNITGSGVLPGRNGNFKDVVTKLTKSLHRVMGRSLEEYAGGQSQHALTMLADILGTNK
ncbi:TOG array regulator of axonemal microtubules protein 2, partial [Mantella aurantiaca]